MTIKNS